METMTSMQRVKAVIAGQVPDRVPVVPQCFMFAAATLGYSIGQINRNPELLARSHIACREKYGYDGCVIDIDDASLAEACGAVVKFRENDVAAVDESKPALSSLREIDSLHFPDPNKDARLPQWLEVTRRLKAYFGDEVWVMGRADQGPFDLLCLLRGSENFMIDLLTEEEDVIAHALDWCANAHIAFCHAQVEAGADATSMGDAYASPNLISPQLYEKFAVSPEIKVVNEVQTPDVPYSIHICGDTTSIIKAMGSTGAKILELDWKVDMGRARALLPQSTVIMGNVDPSDPLVLGTPDDVDAVARHIIEATQGRGLILSSGCAMGANTKPENMAALVAAAKKYGVCSG